MASLKGEIIKVDERLRHIAFIMDGNGRWAKKRGMPREYGHKKGAQVFREMCDYCNELGIKYMTVYAFSTENWNRPQAEVDALMTLLENYLKTCLKTAKSIKKTLQTILKHILTITELQHKKVQSTYLVLY